MSFLINTVLILLGLFLVFLLIGMIYRTVRVFLIRHVFDEWEIFKKDEYDWSQYNKEYQKQLSKVAESNYSENLIDKKFNIIDGEIILDPSLPPLQPIAKILFETIYNLNPSSVLEVGCGCGGNLYNINKILPNARVSGCELLKDQLEFFGERYPQLIKQINPFINDITTSIPETTADLVYTCTVIMHIHGRNRHINALKNLFHAAEKYVVLAEDWGKHTFYDDILKVCKSPYFPWKTYNLYYHDNGGEIIVVVSKDPLKGYKVLTSNKELHKYPSKVHSYKSR